MNWLRNFGIVLALFIFTIGAASCTKKEELPKSKVVTWEEEARKDVPMELKKRFVRYWDARSQLDWGATYAIEAPHSRWLLSKNMYEARHRMAGKPLKVVAKRMIVHHPDAVEIEMELTLENARTLKDETFTPKDYWVRVHGEWYHVEKNPFQRFF